MSDSCAGWTGSSSHWNSGNREAADPGAQPARYQKASAGGFSVETCGRRILKFRTVLIKIQPMSILSLTGHGTEDENA